MSSKRRRVNPDHYALVYSPEAYDAAAFNPPDAHASFVGPVFSEPDARLEGRRTNPLASFVGPVLSGAAAGAAGAAVSSALAARRANPCGSRRENGKASKSAPFATGDHVTYTAAFVRARPDLAGRVGVVQGVERAPRGSVTGQPIVTILWPEGSVSQIEARAVELARRSNPYLALIGNPPSCACGGDGEACACASNPPWPVGESTVPGAYQVQNLTSTLVPGDGYSTGTAPAYQPFEGPPLPVGRNPAPLGEQLEENPYARGGFAPGYKYYEGQSERLNAARAFEQMLAAANDESLPPHERLMYATRAKEFAFVFKPDYQSKHRMIERADAALSSLVKEPKRSRKGGKRRSRESAATQAAISSLTRQDPEFYASIAEQFPSTTTGAGYVENPYHKDSPKALAVDLMTRLCEGAPAAHVEDLLASYCGRDKKLAAKVRKELEALKKRAWAVAHRGVERLKGRASNPGKASKVGLAAAARLPGFDAGAEAFRKFHGGLEPKDVRIVRVDDGKKKTTRKVVVGLGVVPETHYVTPYEGSNKQGYYWVHEHPEGKEPLEVLDPETGVTMKIGGSFKVTDWWHD